MKLFDTEHYNGIYISFKETCGMAPYEFEYKIELSCCRNEYKLCIHPEKDDMHEEIEDIPNNCKEIDVDHSYFDYIFKRIKEINFDVFLYDNYSVLDDGCIIFEIIRNKYSLEVYYFQSEIQELKCSNHILELNNVFEELKKKINYNEWYLEIKRKYNLLNKW